MAVDAVQALVFVNLLVPGKFDEATEWLTKDAEYLYQGKMLRGAEIIGAFKTSHEKAEKQLDEITYLPAEIESVDGNSVTVKVFDRLKVDGEEHLYADRLVVTLVNVDGVWLVQKLEHRPIAEEREKLKQFLSKE